MVQVKAINTRKVRKVDGTTIFNIVKQMTGESTAEINRVISPKLVPMIGRNDADEASYWYRQQGRTGRESWDVPQQVSWGNALKHLTAWSDKAGNYRQLSPMIDEAVAAGLPAPPAWVAWHKTNSPVAWTQGQKEAVEKEEMKNALIQSVSWSDRARETSRVAGLSGKALKQDFLNKHLTTYQWRGKSAQAKQQMLDTRVAQKEKDERIKWFESNWKASKARWDPEVLMFAGENQPQYYMSWIIANTYHSMNPEVKNISYYEGRYKYRNWELKERYYPAIGAGDTLPKTTAQWPRYPADNRLLNIFDLSEMAAALKTTFTGKQDKMASLAAKAKADHQTQQEKTKQSYLASHQVKSTISQIIAGGLDEFNDRKFRYNYSYSPDGTGGYRNQQSEDIPPNERIKIEWIDLQKSMGLQQFNAAIKEYESNAQSKHDRIVRDAKADLDRAKAQVANAKKSSKAKRKSSKN